MFDVIIHGDGAAFAGRIGESVLDALRPVHHRHINAGCRNGGCGVCKVRILSGHYHTGPMSAAHVSEKERAEGIVLACRAYPSKSVAIEILGKVPKQMVRRFGFLTH